jgi:hypothetical protein
MEDILVGQTRRVTISADNGLEDIWKQAAETSQLEMETRHLMFYNRPMSMPTRKPSPPTPAPVPATHRPTPAPAEPVGCLKGRTREEYFFDVLSPITSGLLLTDPSTPQGMAFHYFVNDDPYLDDPCRDTIEQRYGLTTLYYATEGADWSVQAGWLGPLQECQWFGVECPDGSQLATRLTLGKYLSVWSKSMHRTCLAHFHFSILISK